MSTPAETERKRDKALEDSFPASDPPASSGTTSSDAASSDTASSGTKGTDKPDKPSHHRNIDEQPTGTPTSDRHGTETAHQWEHEHKPKP